MSAELSTSGVVTSDVVGLIRIAPFSRRSFMTASAVASVETLRAARAASEEAAEDEWSRMQAWFKKYKVFG